MGGACSSRPDAPWRTLAGSALATILLKEGLGGKVWRRRNPGRHARRRLATRPGQRRVGFNATSRGRKGLETLSWEREL